jgi:hypothetical protein
MKAYVDQILDVVSIAFPDLFDSAASVCAKVDAVLAVICIFCFEELSFCYFQRYGQTLRLAS